MFDNVLVLIEVSFLWSEFTDTGLKIGRLLYRIGFGPMAETFAALQFFLQFLFFCYSIYYICQSIFLLIKSAFRLLCIVCCVFPPALGCCAHRKAGWNTFFNHFQPFLFILIWKNSCKKSIPTSFQVHTAPERWSKYTTIVLTLFWISMTE